MVVVIPKVVAGLPELEGFEEKDADDMLPLVLEVVVDMPVTMETELEDPYPGHDEAAMAESVTGRHPVGYLS